MENDNEMYIKILEDYLKNCTNKKSEIKAEILLHYFKGVKTKSLAPKYSLSQRTIQRYAADFKKNGQSSLDYKEFKKPKIITDEIRSELYNDMKNNPLDFNLPYSVWDDYTLKVYLERKYQLSVSSSTLIKIINDAKNRPHSDFFDLQYKDQSWFGPYFKAKKNFWVLHFIYLGVTRSKAQKSPNKIALRLTNRFYGVILQFIQNDAQLDDAQLDDKQLDGTQYIDVKKIISDRLGHDRIFWVVNECVRDKLKLKDNSQTVVIAEYSKKMSMAIQKLYKKKSKQNLPLFLLIPKHQSIPFLNKVKWLHTIDKLISYKKGKGKKVDDDPDSKICFSGLGIKTVKKNFEVLVPRAEKMGEISDKVKK